MSGLLAYRCRGYITAHALDQRLAGCADTPGHQAERVGATEPISARLVARAGDELGDGRGERDRVWTRGGTGAGWRAAWETRSSNAMSM